MLILGTAHQTNNQALSATRWRRSPAGRWTAASVALAITGLCLTIGNGASAQPAADRRDTDAARQQRRTSLGDVRRWGYQLRIGDLAPLAASDTDMLVVDQGYVAQRDGKITFDPADIARLKTRPDGRRRIILSYFSIGEAEQYRYYWRPEWCQRASTPAWMGAVNPNWPSNYPVRFWHLDWQRLMLDGDQSYLARIKAQGFDGVYLDRADVYGEWTRERPSAEQDMITFINRLAAKARAQDPRFLVVMQNAEELLVHQNLRRVLDGVAKEDLLHGIEFSEAANDPEMVKGSLSLLKRARADKIPVFAVEYLGDLAKITAARRKLAGYGFLPYFGSRLLDRLTSDTNPVGNTTPPALALRGEGGLTCLLD